MLWISSTGWVVYNFFFVNIADIFFGYILRDKHYAESSCVLYSIVYKMNVASFSKMYLHNILNCFFLWRGRGSEKALLALRCDDEVVDKVSAVEQIYIQYRVRVVVLFLRPVCNCFHAIYGSLWLCILYVQRSCFLVWVCIILYQEICQECLVSEIAAVCDVGEGGGWFGA